MCLILKHFISRLENTVKQRKYVVGCQNSVHWETIKFKNYVTNILKVFQDPPIKMKARDIPPNEEANK